MSQKNITLFVYGTLRRGEINHSFLKQANQKLQQCWVKGELHDTGAGYPIIRKKESSRVYGEIYQVSKEELSQIDELEDYHPNRPDNLYERVEQTVYTNQGSLKAFVYIEGKQCISPSNCIKSGDWKEYILTNSERPIYYFAYGSSMDHTRFKEANVHPFFQFIMGRGTLQGYTLRFTLPTNEGGKADIVEEGGNVEGKVYLIDRQTLMYLYEEEGVSRNVYRPTFVWLELKSKQMIEAVTFVVVDKQKETAPSEDFKKEILRGGKEFLSDNYYDLLERHIAILEKGEY
ncbi:gamma-glutamylcyclotransferase [Bacillus solitudinis]|uniref:gamma-glutamylcyclotransferase n=1 Tax=Bacillus solitudinis TaxID=2014074 RepID=UPI0018E254A0|nr:gamma-glutamylcyclotransferase family protein [Bacillus solitudinis]